MGLTDQLVAGLDHGIITMKKGEVALFTLSSESGYEFGSSGDIPPNSVLQFEVELISWIRVVDIYKDGGVLKKIMEKGSSNERPSDLDEVLGILTLYAYFLLLFQVEHVNKTRYINPIFYVTLSLWTCFISTNYMGSIIPESCTTAVKYQVALFDGTVVAETPEEGVEFHVKDGICTLISLNRVIIMFIFFIIHVIICCTS